VPLEVYNPRRRFAWVCFALLVLCVAVFVVELGTIVGGDEAFSRRYGAVPAAVLAGRTRWSVVTYMFLHGGLAHLVGNAWFL